MLPRHMTLLELYCGIGGCAAALSHHVRVVAAVDQNRQALAVYSHNFPHPVVPRAVESIPEADWRRWNADVWWMSPPCPPYTPRGRRRDLDDKRARSLAVVLERISALRPMYVAFENVPGFAGTRAHDRLRAVLQDAGYETHETLLCPTELGLPNRRLRFYLVAGRGDLAAWPARTGPPVLVSDVLDPVPVPELWCDADLASRYAGALDVINPGRVRAPTACFTSAYGRSLVRSGSYLATPSGLRRFSPAEIVRLLDFPPSYRLPPDLPPALAWRLVGNSVSVRAVRWILAAVPGLI